MNAHNCLRLAKYGFKKKIEGKYSQHFQHEQLPLEIIESVPLFKLY